MNFNKIYNYQKNNNHKKLKIITNKIFRINKNYNYYKNKNNKIINSG